MICVEGWEEKKGREEKKYDQMICDGEIFFFLTLKHSYWSAAAGPGQIEIKRPKD